MRACCYLSRQALSVVGCVVPSHGHTRTQTHTSGQCTIRGIFYPPNRPDQTMPVRPGFFYLFYPLSTKPAVYSVSSSSQGPAYYRMGGSL